MKSYNKILIWKVEGPSALCSRGGATSSETRLYSAFTDRYQEWLLRCRSRAARKRPVTVWAEYLPLRHESFEFPPNDWRPLNLLATDSASGQAE